MKQSVQSGSSDLRPANRMIALGKARKLTRASFSGSQPEMILDREYTVGIYGRRLNEPGGAEAFTAQRIGTVHEEPPCCLWTFSAPPPPDAVTAS